MVGHTVTIMLMIPLKLSYMHVESIWKSINPDLSKLANQQNKLLKMELILIQIVGNGL